MSGALHVLAAFAGAAAVLCGWVLILFVIPGLMALYLARLFPLTGQWRKKFRDRFR